LICRKNNWTAEVNGIPLVNGLTGVVDGTDESSYRKNTMVLDFLADDLPASFNNLKIDLRMLNKLKLDKDLDSRSRYDIFDYGYAITGHLAQGSQYSSVLVVADCMGFSDAQSWLYTAVTRAIDRVVIAF
jgi:ATP-dependent exoDNAse (exonuclease V) alpha subunit